MVAMFRPISIPPATIMKKFMGVSQLIWTPVDFDPRSISTSRYGLPGPNLLRRYGPPGVHIY